MTFEEAKKLLESATRWELRDHAFGDCEYGWAIGLPSKEIAAGYSGSGNASVYMEAGGTFAGDEARELMKLGTRAIISRNDETGPDEYVEGQTMPGLTLEGVLEELTN